MAVPGRPLVTAGYRADGLRAWKQTSGGRAYYLYYGDNPVEELDGSANKTAVMTFGPNGVLARTTATRTLLYSMDTLGQMAQQIDAVAGTIVASYLFDAWGARQVNTSDPTASSDPYSGYNTAAGYITDWETGLELLGHRYYDPAAGRFLNRDPIGMVGGVNVYAYCSNGAVGKSDPSGSRSGVGSARHYRVWVKRAWTANCRSKFFCRPCPPGRPFDLFRPCYNRPGSIGGNTDRTITVYSRGKSRAAPGTTFGGQGVATEARR
jgi:RHS repeat-associated protein